MLWLCKYKAWADQELIFELEKLDEATHPTERHTAIRLISHSYSVDRIFSAHLSGIAHACTATNTSETTTFIGFEPFLSIWIAGTSST